MPAMRAMLALVAVGFFGTWLTQGPTHAPHPDTPAVVVTVPATTSTSAVSTTTTTTVLVHASRAAARPRPSIVRPSATFPDGRPCTWRDKRYCWSDDPFAVVSACEAGMNPNKVSASGKYLGAFQWDLSSWHGLGETGSPVDAQHNTYAYQLGVAKRMQEARGWGPWPTCARKLGLL